MENNLPTLEFYYENWRGELGLRKVQDPRWFYGESKYHKGQQWFIHAFDLDRQDFRDFAVLDIRTFINNSESKIG